MSGPSCEEVTPAGVINLAAKANMGMSFTDILQFALTGVALLAGIVAAIAFIASYKGKRVCDH